MATMDVFNDDAFSVTTLSAAISEAPFQPTRLLELGLFRNEPIETTDAWFELDGDTLRLVKAGQRGAPGETRPRGARRAVAFRSKHLKRDDAMMADEVQNARAFGQQSEVETVQGKVLRIGGRHRRDIETTIEFHRMGALKGLILDADGTTVLEDLYDKFQVAKIDHDMNLDVDTTDLLKMVVQAKRKSEDVLGASYVSGFRAFCGDQFFDDFVAHPELKTSYERWRDGEVLRTDVRAGLTFGGVTWENYRGSVAGVPFVASDEAILVPEGVPDMFLVELFAGRLHGNGEHPGPALLPEDRSHAHEHWRRHSGAIQPARHLHPAAGHHPPQAHLMARASAAFARMHDRLFAHFGEQAVLREGECVEAIITENVETVGGYGEVPVLVTTATLRASVQPRKGDPLDIIGGRCWELDAMLRGDARVQEWILRDRPA
ncbi:MAG: major capsid protein [Thauera sp.]